MTPPEQIQALVSLEILSDAVLRLKKLEDQIRIYGPAREDWLNTFDAAIIQAQASNDIVREHLKWNK